MVIKVTNPIVENNLSLFRNKETPPNQARNCVENISYFLASAVSSTMEVTTINVTTPLGEATDSIIISQQIELIPIMRAGLAMLPPFLTLFPYAHIGPVACERHHDLSVSLKYEKILHNMKAHMAIILDPMLATGHTVASVIDVLEKRNAEKIVIVSILAARRGIEYLRKKGDYTIVTVKDNEGLNANAYLYPGVGDSGDRLFGSVL